MKEDYEAGSHPKATSKEQSAPIDHTHPFAKALSRIVTADAASSRAAIVASKATKPSLHTRFFHDPVKDRA